MLPMSFSESHSNGFVHSQMNTHIPNNHSPSKKHKKKELENHDTSPLLASHISMSQNNPPELKKKDPSSLPSCATCRKAHKKCERPPEAPETCKACLRKSIQCSPATESGRRRPSESHRKKAIKTEINHQNILGPTGNILQTSSPFSFRQDVIGDSQVMSPEDYGKKKRRHERRISKTSSVVEQMETAQRETGEMFQGLVSQISTYRNSKRYSLPPRETGQYITEFKVQEKQRFEQHPTKIFTYNLCGIKYIATPAAAQVKDRDSCLLDSVKPAGVTFMGLVRDAVARMPGGVGSWQDIVGLIKDSSYLKQGISDPEIKNAVSTALIRLQNESDNSVNFIRDLQFWLYLHKNREAEIDFQPNDKRISDTPIENETFEWAEPHNLMVDSDQEDETHVSLPYVEPYVPSVSTDDEREVEMQSNLPDLWDDWAPFRNEMAWRWRWLSAQLKDLSYLDQLTEFELKFRQDCENEPQSSYPWRPVYDHLSSITHPLAYIHNQEPLKKARLDNLYLNLEPTPFPEEVVLKIKNKQRKSRQDEVLRNEVFSSQGFHDLQRTHLCVK